MIDSAAADWERDGFLIASVYGQEAYKKISEYAIQWVEALISANISRPLSDIERIENYHLWWHDAQVNHDDIFRAKSRHRAPEVAIRDMIVNAKVSAFLNEFLPGGWRLWDEGLGWLGFRLVRPGMNDGYPPSCKAWGPAKDVISLWVPIVGFGPCETLSIVSGSHKKDIESVLPETSKFCKDEYRVRHPDKLSFSRPSMIPGEIILFDPRLIHSEDVEHADITRLNLEVRICPELTRDGREQ